MGLRRGVKLLLAIAVSLWLSATRIEAQLQVGYYAHSCPVAEIIVKGVVFMAVNKDPGLAAGLLRLHFHDCFVRGCEASVLLASTANNTAERDSPPNKSLRGFEVIDEAKSLLEIACRKTVSCADIVAFAARDSVAMAGGLGYDVPAGRRDGTVSKASEALTNLPPPTANLSQLIQMFANKGLTQDEMITLSGAHTIGRSHCSTISSRLYSFNSTSSTDPSLDPTYAAKLKQECPQASNDTSLVVPLDPVTPNTFDINYYRNLLVNRGLFTSDQTLMSSANSSAEVKNFANDSNSFMNSFVAAMVKMGQIGVLTGNAGEIRTNCSAVN